MVYIPECKQQLRAMI